MAGPLSGDWERIYVQAHAGCGQIQILAVVELRSPFHPGCQPEAVFQFLEAREDPAENKGQCLDTPQTKT